MVSSLHNRPIVPTHTTVTQGANTPPAAPEQAQAQAQQAAPTPKKGEAPRPFGSDSFSRKAGGNSKLPPAAGELMEKLAAGDLGGAKKSLLALLEGGGEHQESLEELLADEGGHEAADNHGAGGAQKGQGGGSLGNLLLKALKDHPELAKGLLGDPRQLRELLKNPAKARAQLSGAGGLAELLGLSGPDAVDAVDNERSGSQAQRAHADELLGLDRVSRPPQKSDEIDNLAYV
jgi:hypothetical protein